MKCIRFYRPHGGYVARVSDDDAAREVKAGKAIYCPKRWFKAANNLSAQEKSNDRPRKR